MVWSNHSGTRSLERSNSLRPQTNGSIYTSIIRGRQSKRKQQNTLFMGINQTPINRLPKKALFWNKRGRFACRLASFETSDKDQTNAAFRLPRQSFLISLFFIGPIEEIVNRNVDSWINSENDIQSLFTTCQAWNTFKSCLLNAQHTMSAQTLLSGSCLYRSTNCLSTFSNFSMKQK